MQPSNLTFYHLGIAPKMLSILDRMKFVSPTPIQHKAIPIALEEKDIVGIAQTGTGKTLAFGIPLVQRLTATGGKALVLVPTRELAIQVEDVLRKILQPFGFLSVVLIGGAPMHRQIQMLRRNAQVIIATPGRLADHMNQKTVSLKDVKILVLDEADRMFDMGFQPQVEKIIQEISKERQTLLFSATMPTDIVKLATRHMRLPIHVEIAPQGTAAEQVSQELFIVQEETKKALVVALLNQYRGAVLLFIRTKMKAKRITRLLRDKGHNAAEIHSDRSMGQRKQAMEGFRAGRYRILVATDIASRGIDVTDIELVINYDLPDEIENYVHRIGRTGRAGTSGHAITFATPDQGPEVARIEKLIRKSLPVAKHPEFPEHQFIQPTKPSSSFRGLRNRKRRSFSPSGGGRQGGGSRRRRF